MIRIRQIVGATLGVVLGSGLAGTVAGCAETDDENTCDEPGGETVESVVEASFTHDEWLAYQRDAANFLENDYNYCELRCVYFGFASGPQWLLEETLYGVPRLDLSDCVTVRPPRPLASELHETDTGESDGSEIAGWVQCTNSNFTPYCPDPPEYVDTVGRRPLGHVEARTIHTRSRALGSRLAQSAHLEAASVVAFVQLARQLKDWGAPDAFARRCLSAARDEVLHARLMTTLAQAQGVDVPPVDAAAADAATQTATLEMAALHNAVEGCVSETWAALQAHWQSRHAPGEAMRQVQARIAADETRHAQLAWDLHEWFLSQLDDAAAARIQRAQRGALAKLPARMTATALAHAEAAIHDHDLRALGLPTPAQTHALATDYAARLAV